MFVFSISWFLPKQSCGQVLAELHLKNVDHICQIIKFIKILMRETENLPKN